MKKIISKIPVFKTNKLCKKVVSVLGHLLLVSFILFNATFLVIAKANTNEFILGKKQSEVENYIPKLDMKQGAEALTKKIGVDTRTSINKKKSNVEKIYFKDRNPIAENSSQNEINITEKSNDSKESDTYSKQSDVSNQTSIDMPEEQQGAPIEVEWDKVTASSELISGGIYYKASNVIDRNCTTPWVEGKDGDGVGEWIKLEKNSPFIINAVGLMNGYQKSEYLYYANNRPKKVLVEFSDGTSVTKELVDRYRYFIEIYLGKEITTQYVKITILEVYKGTKYQDTCISNICAYH